MQPETAQSRSLGFVIEKFRRVSDRPVSADENAIRMVFRQKGHSPVDEVQPFQLAKYLLNWDLVRRGERRTSM
jgi:hypothetical protein